MNKLKIFIVSILGLFCLGFRAVACGGWYHPYEAYDLRMFRFYCQPSSLDNGKVANCLLWQQQTSPSIPIDDIMEVVYFWDLEKYESSAQWNGISVPDNLFSNWLSKEAHKNAYECLLYSKKIEKLRAEMRDPWYYSYDEDEVHKSLKYYIGRLEGLCVGQSSKDYWLHQRADLQIARAMFVLKDYEGLVSKWESSWSEGEPGYLRNQIEGYVAGAYLRTGNAEIARQMYGALGDAESLIYSYQVEGLLPNSGFMGSSSDLEYVYQYSPDCSTLKKWLEYRVNDAYYGSGKHYYQDERMDDIANFVEKVVKEKRCKDMAPWYYAAAFFALDDDNYAKVKRYVSLAKASNPDDFMRQSIEVLDLFADAKYMPLGEAYEARLLKGIKYLSTWLETEDVKNLSYQYVAWRNAYNSSGFYPVDMLKKVLHGVVCPRYIKAGKIAQAMALAYYGDYALAGFIKGHVIDSDYITAFNETRWRTYSFFLLDTKPVNYDVAFFTEKYDGADSPLYKYMRNRVLPDRDYMCDIIGTRYLRQMNYVRAKQWLSRVSNSYENTLNVSYWLENRNPFKWLNSDFAELKNQSDDKRFKLYFATKMCEFERTMCSKSDVNGAALAKLHYSLGIEASFNESWAYTRYSNSNCEEDFRWIGYIEYNNRINYSSMVPEHSVKYPTKAKQRVATLRREAFSSFTDKTKEAIAHFTLLPSLYENCNNEQEITEYYRTHCDGNADYKRDRRR